MEWKDYAGSHINSINEQLSKWVITDNSALALLYESMRYSLLSGGKRLRGCLTLAACEVACSSSERALDAACAVEIIHTYSLIHDDLPCMDDDDFRRGRPTNHKVYGDAIATLAGDALLTIAFEILVRGSIARGASPSSILRCVSELAACAGPNGMVGGQAMDLAAEGKFLSLDELSSIHSLKTGAMYLASVRIGAILGGADENLINILSEYARRIGLAFQIIDDVLDLEGDVDIIGKPIGSDVKNAKSTYPSIIGLEESKAMSAGLVAEAEQIIKGLGAAADPLVALARYIVARDC